MSAPQTVCVVNIHHRRGSDTHVCATSDKAWRVLFEHVKDWWDDEHVPGKIPENETEAVHAYFGHVEDEFYDLTTTEVLT